MSRPKSDADVLTHVSRRLFAESREEFRVAHKKWQESCGALTTGDHLRCFGEAVKKEGRALAKQREAIELQRRAIELRAKGWEEFKVKTACKPPAS